MALQTSGAISFADLQTEFGGTNPISLSEYIRNVGDTSLAGGANEIRYTPAVSGSSFTLGGSQATNLVVTEISSLKEELAKGRRARIIERDNVIPFEKDLNKPDS